jgi:hypothetical protein
MDIFVAKSAFLLAYTRVYQECICSPRSNLGTRTVYWVTGLGAFHMSGHTHVMGAFGELWLVWLSLLVRRTFSTIFGTSSKLIWFSPLGRVVVRDTSITS